MGKAENEMIVQVIFRSSWQLFLVSFLLRKEHTSGAKELRSQLYSHMCKQSLSPQVTDLLRYDLGPHIWPI